MTVVLRFIQGFDFAERTKKRIDYLFVAPKDNSPWTIQDYAVLESRYDDTVGYVHTQVALTDQPIIRLQIVTTG